MASKSIVGDVINFRGLVYAPANEMGVVTLFAKISEEAGFIIEEIRVQYPDCIARRQVDKGWERVAIEFELNSSNFRRHRHDPVGCDLIVCWDHDWETCPLPVLALKPFIAEHVSNTSAPLSRVRAAQPLQVRRTTLTLGGVKNGYLNIKPLDDFWPEECLGANIERAEQYLIVEFERVGRLATDISGRHKTFRSTSANVKRFIRAFHLRAGDEVEILRVEKYEYKIRPVGRRPASRK